MTLIRRILVAIKDPAATTHPAVSKAAQLAKALDADLELFHAISTTLYIDPFAPSDTTARREESMRAGCLAQLNAIAAPLRGQQLRVNVAAEWDFPAYEAIIRRAKQVESDLIVAGCHAQSHVGGGLLRLTDWELLRLSPVPTLLVKRSGRYSRPVVLAAVDPAHLFAKTAELDENILRTGRVVADALEGTLHAMHAQMPFPLAGPPPHGTIDAPTLERLDAEVASETRQRFDRALRATGISSEQRHLVQQTPANAIRETASKLESSIVVMGALSRSGLKRLFIGNTAESVLDDLTCDVLIVKPADFRARVARNR
ncbi:MAG TPA: universal stress protein, partial [Steroidobacteraceae bacterium]